jgi:methyl coenzyme M reductase subunit C
MAIPGNPRQYARDIADGFVVFNKATCRQFAPEELRSLHQLLEQVARVIRAEQVPLEEVPEIQRKNLRLSRTNSALLLLRNHAKRQRLAL